MYISFKLLRNSKKKILLKVKKILSTYFEHYNVLSEERLKIKKVFYFNNILRYTIHY